MSDGASQFCPGIRGGQDRGMHALSWAVPLLKLWGCPQTSLLTGILGANVGVWPESLGGNGGTRSEGLAQGGPEGQGEVILVNKHKIRHGR